MSGFLDRAVEAIVVSGLWTLSNKGMLCIKDTHPHTLFEKYFINEDMLISIHANPYITKTEAEKLLVNPSKTEVEKPKTQKEKKEPRKKRGKSAWDIYLAEKRGEFKTYLLENKEVLETLECKNVSAAVLKYAGQQWRSLEDKTYYEEMSAKSKEEASTEKIASVKSDSVASSKETTPNTTTRKCDESDQLLTPAYNYSEGINPVVIGDETYYVDISTQTFYEDQKGIVQIKKKTLINNLKKEAMKKYKIVFDN